MSKKGGGENIKCVIVGDGAVGKTCLMMTFISNKFPSDYIPTTCDNLRHTMVVDGFTVGVGLWDTAGQEEYDRLRPLSYPETDVFIVCYSVINPVSFENITQKWMPELESHAPGVPIVLVGTKTDLKTDQAMLAQLKKKNEKVITSLQEEAVARKIGASKFLECSALTRENLETVFLDAVRAAKQHKAQQKAASAGCCTLL